MHLDKDYTAYIDAACKAIDHWSGDKIVAAPTQLQTLTLALVMAITDLIKELHANRQS